MFVAKWEPSFIPKKPELTSAPIWLELRNVPLQFFHEEGLEHIAGLVGDPKFLHLSTANKTNLEVAKVFTLIDPRKPLPEAVNVRFQSGQIERIKVSSSWMPPVCKICKEIGHSRRFCKQAPITCTVCPSSNHSSENCPRAKKEGTKKRRNQKKPRLIDPALAFVRVDKESVVTPTKVSQIKLGKETVVSELLGEHLSVVNTPACSLKETSTSLIRGESSKASHKGVDSELDSIEQCSDGVLPSDSEVEADSSDIQSSESERENFVEVRSRRRQKEGRGKSLKSNPL